MRSFPEELEKEEINYSRQTLPGTLAGGNAINMARLLGLPYMTTDASAYGHRDILQSLDESTAEVIRKASTALSQGLLNHSQDVAAFILKARDRNSSVSKAFRSARPKSVDEDKIAVALSIAAGIYKR